jgi:hypothetical protein
MAKKITRIIGEIQRDPFTGIGKPEPLKGDRLSGAVCAVEYRAQAIECAGERVLGRCAVADDQRRTCAVAERRHSGLRQPLPFRASDQLGLPRAVRGKFQDRVQPGGDPGHPDARSTLGQRGDEPVQAPPVVPAHPPHMPVVRTRGDQLGKGQLVQDG